jgi:hypothetical protein
MNLFNVQDAKTISYNSAGQEIKDIINQIKNAARDKKTQICIPEISQAAVCYFASNGFGIMPLINPIENVSVCTISWG